MGDVIGQILPLAIGVALSPMPIIAVILMLATPKGKTNGLAFSLGWLSGSTIAAAVVLLSSTGAEEAGGDPSLISGAIKLVLGIVLLLVAVKQWRSRPAPDEEVEMPRWMQGLDSFTAPKAFGLAALLSGVNPKNLALTAAAASTIAVSGLAMTDQWIAVAAFVIIAALGVLLPVGVYFLGGEKASEVLDGWKMFMSNNNTAIMAVLFLIFGFKLLGDGIEILF